METKTPSSTTAKALFGFIFAAGLVVPGFAQETEDISGSQVAAASIRPDCERTEARGRNPYEAVALAANDMSITLKVKRLLRSDRVTRQDDIHVGTAAAVVTLSGIVPNAAIAAHAERLVRSTEGVRDMVNHLQFRLVSD
jgi:osmotically-inducible protein OsmY